MLSLQWPSPEALRVQYCSAGKFVCGSDRWRHQKRKVDTYVLFLGCKGNVYLRQGEQEYCLEPDGYLILLANTEHEGIRCSSPEYYWCHFTPEEEPLLTDSPTDGCALPLQGKLPSPEAQRLLFCQMADSSAEEASALQTVRNRLLEALLLRLLPQSSAVPTNPLIANVIHYLRLNATQITQVGEVAEHFGYNKEYLTTLLRKATGRSLLDHLLFFRMEKAKEMLLQGDLPIAQVAYACGFRDVKYFHRCFSRWMGLSPGSYRNHRPRIPWNNQ